MSESKKRICLLIGESLEDQARGYEPLSIEVVGVMSREFYEVIDEVEEERIWKACRDAYDPDGTQYEWRKVWVDLPYNQLRSLFNTTVIEGTVVEGLK